MVPPPRRRQGDRRASSKLSRILFDHIRQHLPRVIEGIESHIKQRRQRLLELGNSRTEPGQHRAYLTNIAKRFESLSRDAIRGLYTDGTFFGALDTDSGQMHDQKKLRASIRRHNRAFVAVMSKHGANRVVLMPDDKPPASLAGDAPPYLQPIIDQYQLEAPNEVSWEDFNAELEDDARDEEGD